MATRKAKKIPRKRSLERLRFFTDVVGRITRGHISPALEEAIAQHARRKLPPSTVQHLGTKRADIAALKFICEALENR